MCFNIIITLFFQEGIFSVPMRAVLPKADIAVPDFLKFGMCAVKDCIEVMFQITNTR